MADRKAEERRRASVLTDTLVGSLTNAEAAAELRLSVRQVCRLKKALKRAGPAALIHGNRGRPPVHRLSDEVRARLVQLATGPYAGVGHQQLCKLLAEREQLPVSRSTLRRVLLAAGLRSPRTRPLRLPTGAMPITFDLSRRRVQLLDLGGAVYRESSLSQTVERWRREHPEALNFELDLEAFIATARREPGRIPDGFLFDAGRCGSAALANALSACDEYLVIKESPAVNALLASLVNDLDDRTRRECEALVARGLAFMFRPARGVERRLFFLLSSWNIRLADTLLRLFPDTPAIMLYRPVDLAVASLLSTPPRWRSLLDRPRATQARLFPSLAAVPAEAPLSAAAFYAHTWRSAVEAALTFPRPRLLLFDYGQVRANPVEMLAKLLDHFGLAVSPEALSDMSQVVTSFNDRPLHGAPLDPEQAAEVQSVAGDLPQHVAARRLNVESDPLGEPG